MANKMLKSIKFPNLTNLYKLPIWTGTETQYDALGSYDPNMLYFLTDASVSSISVTTSPTTTEYYVGDTLDLTGLVVTATYSDGTTCVIPNSSLEFTPSDGTTLTESGSVTVYIRYYYTSGDRISMLPAITRVIVYDDAQEETED